MKEKDIVDDKADVIDDKKKEDSEIKNDSATIGEAEMIEESETIEDSEISKGSDVMEGTETIEEPEAIENSEIKEEEDYELQAMKSREKAGLMSTFMLNRLGDIAILHFMFLIFSIPIVTIGAALSATSYVGMKLAGGAEGSVMSNFVKGFKDNFKRSTLYFLIAAASGALLILAYKYWSAVNGMIGIVMSITTIILALVWIMTTLYLFAVQAKFYNTFSAIIKNSFLMSVRHLQYTLLMVGIIVVFVYLFATFSIFQALEAVLGAGILGLAFGKIFNKVFANYV